MLDRLRSVLPCHWGVRDAQGGEHNLLPASPAPCLGWAQPRSPRHRIPGTASLPSATQRYTTGKEGTHRPGPPRPPQPRARTAVEGVDPGEPRQAAVAQRLHAREGYASSQPRQPARISQQRRRARAGGGGRRPRRGLDGREGHGRLPGHTAAFLPGYPGKEVLPGNGSVPPPAPASPGGAELSIPPHAATPTLCRGLGTGEEEEERTVAAPGNTAAPARHLKQSWGKGGAWIHHPFHHGLVPFL